VGTAEPGEPRSHRTCRSLFDALVAALPQPLSARGFEPVGVTAGLITGDVPPEPGKGKAILANTLAGGSGKALRATAGVAADAL
jgi:hypothetical protein